MTVCYQCNIDKDDEEFTASGLIKHRCKSCVSLYFANYYVNNKTNISDSRKTPEFRQRQRNLKKLPKHKLQAQKYRRTMKFKENRNKRLRSRHQLLRMAALVAYSGENPSCACCGENNTKFLTMDHTDNNGKKHRRELNSVRRYRNATGFLLWLKDNSYPSGFQVLCFNCNCGKGAYGICPHRMVDSTQ